MLRYEIVAGLLAGDVGGQAYALLGADMEACERAQEGAQLDDAGDVVAGAVGIGSILRFSFLERHLFGSHQYQHGVSIFQICGGRNVEQMASYLAQALGG